MGRIFPYMQCVNVRPIGGNFEGRWIFQVTLIKMDFSSVGSIIDKYSCLTVIGGLSESGFKAKKKIKK